jgi:hypothetical protein
MNESNKYWLTDEDEILTSLIADESKNKAILVELDNTVRQLKAKSSFRLALLNTLRESRNKSTKENK